MQSSVAARAREAPRIRRGPGRAGAHQCGGQAEDGEQGAGGGEGGVLADPCLLPHLHVGGGDVLGQVLRHHGLPGLAAGHVAPGGVRTWV